MLSKFERAGAWLLLASMLGSFAFGLYYHFVADTIDHVAHVARIGPAFWSAMFRLTACLLAVSELAGKLATLFQLDGDGLIERIYFVMASRKTKALRAGVGAGG